MSVWFYRYAGLQVASEIEIPEWAVFASQPVDSSADVKIMLDNASPAQEFTAGLSGDIFCFNIRDTASYRVRAGQKVTITPAPGAAESDMRLFLLGTAWGVLCYQRGLLALHASVVTINGRTFAFSGHSGAGKSTLAASLVQSGGQLISDDLCCLEFGATEARVFPSAPRLKLWRSALEVLGLQDAGLTRDHFRLDKFHLAPNPAQVNGETIRLDGIYLLKWGEACLERLRGQQAVSQLVRTASYHPELIEQLGCTSAHWQRCLRLVQTTPVWELSRPQDWSTLDEMEFFR